MPTNPKVIAGRNFVEAYRRLHGGVVTPHGHTPLLDAMVRALSGLGYTSEEEELKDRAPEVLAKFWADSDLVNVKVLGYESVEDFWATADEADKQVFWGMWQ